MSDTENTQPTESTQESAQLTINDLVAMKSIIDIASQRGTFKPNEMTVVGQTYTKLMAFLESVKQQGEPK
jgi:ABC-type transporter lipoprotein component MlaA